MPSWERSPSSFFLPSFLPRRFTPAKYRKPILRHHDRDRGSDRVGSSGGRSDIRGWKNRRGPAGIRLRPTLLPAHPPRLRDRLLVGVALSGWGKIQPPTPRTPAGLGSQPLKSIMRRFAALKAVRRAGWPGRLAGMRK